MNGFSAADISTAAANGHHDGYQAGYADAVKAVAVSKTESTTSSAQEAVPAFYLTQSAWNQILVPMTPSRDVTAYRHGFDHGYMKLVPFYTAAPLAAAPVATLVAEMRNFADVADSCPITEGNAGAVIRGWADRLATNPSAAPGIDLRSAILQLRDDALHMKDPGDTVNAYDRVLRLIDASPKGGRDVPSIPEPHQECYSYDGGDTWFDSPEDIDLVGGLEVGDTYTLTVSHYSVERTYRVTKVPDDVSDDYEVEPVQATSAEVGA